MDAVHIELFEEISLWTRFTGICWVPKKGVVAYIEQLNETQICTLKTIR